MKIFSARILFGCGLSVLTLLVCSFVFPVNACAVGAGGGLGTAVGDVWRDGRIGTGFSKNCCHVGGGAGVLFGSEAFGSMRAHNLTLGMLEFGWIFTDVLAPDKWYAGNLELRGELFGGSQFVPNSRYFTGFTPFLRYNLATGTRWVPFVEFGAGLSGTDIGKPDLSTTFEFNLQLGVGTYYFFCKDKAVSLQYRFLHFSNAGIDVPNYGVDTTGVMLGLDWFF